jgi:hypothetical protein
MEAGAMTVEREEPGVFVAVCDRCGERLPLDLDPEASDEEAREEMRLCGWVSGKPERQRFEGCFSSGSYVESYADDLCHDCRDGEPGPRPKFDSGRRVRPHTVDAFDNDPCDEWPRAVVFAAVGLRPGCGHPKGPFPAECDYCRDGYSIGSLSPYWKR